MHKATVLLTLCLAACGGSAGSDGVPDGLLNEEALRSTSAAHDLPVSPGHETGNTDEVCTLFLGHDPESAEERIFYVWLFKTREAAKSYATPDLSPIPDPGSIEQVRNVVIYVPKKFSAEGLTRLKAVTSALEQRATRSGVASACSSE
jgi:hypothetical protein